VLVDIICCWEKIRGIADPRKRLDPNALMLLRGSSRNHGEHVHCLKVVDGHVVEIQVLSRDLRTAKHVVSLIISGFFYHRRLRYI